MTTETTTFDPKPAEAAAVYYELHRRDINTDLIRVTNAVLAVGCGVGVGTITAVRKMLGTEGTRKTYIGPVRKFLRDHPRFRAIDAATKQTRAEFWQREKARTE